MNSSSNGSISNRIASNKDDLKTKIRNDCAYPLGFVIFSKPVQINEIDFWKPIVKQTICWFFDNFYLRKFAQFLTVHLKFNFRILIWFQIPWFLFWLRINGLALICALDENVFFLSFFAQEQYCVGLNKTFSLEYLSMHKLFVFFRVVNL